VIDAFNPTTWGHAFIPPERRVWHSRVLGMSGIGAILPLPPRAQKGLETAQLRMYAAAICYVRFTSILFSNGSRREALRVSTLSGAFSAAGIKIPGGTATSLKLFDLKTGEPKGSIATRGQATLCNDIAVASDGTAYITDSFAGHILRLKPGAKEFEVWAHDPRWDVADKPELDGLAILPDGAIYANIFEGDGLYRIPVNADGSPGKITKLQTSRPLYHSDGLRAFGNKLIMVEGETKGNLDLISIEGDNAKIETIKDGFDGPVSLVQVGDTIYVLDAPLRYLLGPEAKEKKPPPPFKATAVPAPKQ
jgi:hypothetical protein